MNFSLFFTLRPTKKIPPSPHLYLPAYVYQRASTAVPLAKDSTRHLMQTSVNTRSNLTTPQSISHASKNMLPQKSVLAMSRAIIQQNQMNTTLRNMQNSEAPILLVGDKHAIVDPLVKLMARALSAHFTYPKMEGTFGLRGRVLVELTLHPEGYFSNVQIIQSSDNQDFDAAALYAINTAPTINGVNKFLAQPKRFVVGFIFD